MRKDYEELENEELEESYLRGYKDGYDEACLDLNKYLDEMQIKNK